MTSSTSDLPVRLLLTLVMVAVIALSFWAMWRGWRNRAARQTELPAPLALPDIAAAEVLASCLGRYIGTVRDGQWLDRIVAHGLGAPGRCQITVTAGGVSISRDGEAGLYLPAADIVRVGSGKGIAGEVVERDGLGILTWTLGHETLATGFRSDSAEDQRAVLAAISGLIPDMSAEGRTT